MRFADTSFWFGLARGEREYSFVDATSFAVMRRRRIREALAFDWAAPLRMNGLSVIMQASRKIPRVITEVLGRRRIAAIERAVDPVKINRLCATRCVARESQLFLPGQGVDQAGLSNVTSP